MNDTPAPRGRPRKNLAPKVEPKAQSKASYAMKAKPNWEGIEIDAEDTPDRLRIPPHMIPEGMSLQWVTVSVLGQPVPQHRAQFEKKGWTPVHQEDFDGRFDGMFMLKGADGEINFDGLVLMARPQEFTDRARQQDRKNAREQLQIQENALRGGQIDGVTLDAQHKSALQFNNISKSYERVVVPEK